MQTQTQADHIALLAFMICGVLVERLNDCGQLDDATRRHLHHLLTAARKHAQLLGVTDLDLLIDRMDHKLKPPPR
jgi:hypothetical protein